MAARVQPGCLIAIGVVSAPLFVERRTAVRTSWMKWSNVGETQPVRVRFVVRSGQAPPSVAASLRDEAKTNGDVYHVDAVQWNETRLRGPVLSLAAWLTHASEHFHEARFIAKMDDDAYLHVPDLERLLRLHAPANDMLYVGKLAWFHWFDSIFEHAGFGWTYGMAHEAGKRCRNASWVALRSLTPCDGPFPFATGFLSLLSGRLAASLAASARADATRLARLPEVRRRSGELQDRVMEDVWLGSLIYRFPPAEPVRFITLSELNSEALVSDDWGFRAARTALLVHLRGKQPARMGVLHGFLRSDEHCSCATRLSCGRGCDGFLSEAEQFEGAMARLVQRASLRVGRKQRVPMRGRSKRRRS